MSLAINSTGSSKGKPESRDFHTLCIVSQHYSKTGLGAISQIGKLRENEDLQLTSGPALVWMHPDNTSAYRNTGLPGAPHKSIHLAELRLSPVR